MSDAEKLKHLRDVWCDMVDNSHVLTRKEYVDMMKGLSDELIGLAIESRNVFKFLKKAAQLDPDLNPKTPFAELPRKYLLIMEMINERNMQSIKNLSK